MYSSALLLHSWLRWVVIGLVLMAAYRGVSGQRAGRPWSGTDRRANMLATISLDVQLLLGLLLYLLLSPFTTEAMKDFGTAVRTPALRFWAVEHLAMMITAVISAHVGHVVARKAKSDADKHLHAAMFFGGVLLLLLLGTPWPGMANGRPLFRFGL